MTDPLRHPRPGAGRPWPLRRATDGVGRLRPLAALGRWLKGPVWPLPGARAQVQAQSAEPVQLPLPMPMPMPARAPAGLLSWTLAWAAALAVVPATAGAVAADPLARAPSARSVDASDGARVMVKYRAGSALMRQAASNPAPGTRQAQAVASGRMLPLHAQTMGQRLGLALQDGHVLGERLQSVHASGIGSAELAARLSAQPDVEWAAPVKRRRKAAVVPNDPLYAADQTTTTPAVGQWYLRPPAHPAVSSLNAEAAWAITTGAASITVAVLDTGVRFDHPDLAGKLWPGHDFVSRTSNSNDGDGTDSDASDPGDPCDSESASWHGTQVAGLIAAATDNGVGMAGIGRNVKVLPVRVLGTCGGYDDDILAGIQWAANINEEVSNPHPAQVINLSLGDTGNCLSGNRDTEEYRKTIERVINAGVTVVAAAGNNDGQAVILPANCPGVIAVGAARHIGTKVGFSSVGPEVTLAAPGGNCVNIRAGQPCLYPLITTTNSGDRRPGASTYSTSFSYSVGTSFSAPLVAGTVGLMLSAQPSLTPAQVKSMLQATARPFPTIGAQNTSAAACHAADGRVQEECYCTASTCGSGLLDAGAAVARAAGVSQAPQAVIASAGNPSVGVPLALQATPSSASVIGYQWAITSGSGIARLTGGLTGASTTLVLDSPGTVTVGLTVTDASGRSGSGSATLGSVPGVAIAVSKADPVIGDDLVLTAQVTTPADRTITRHEWDILSGTEVAQLGNDTGSSTAALRILASGSVTMQLTVTDSTGATNQTSRVITVAGTTPTGGSGTASRVSGGGATGVLSILGLALAVAGLRRRRG